LLAANAPASAAVAAPAASAADVRGRSATGAADFVRSSASSAPARISAGDFGLAPDVGEIEISSSMMLSSGLSACSIGCTSRGGSTGADATVSTTRFSPGTGGTPPSLNIGLFGSSWRPSATAFCHTSP
jgi:hypothetical protein